MSIEIGQLLGFYNGSQSFESVGSWELVTSQCSLSLVTTNTHSSSQTGRFEIYSGASGRLRYDYYAANDYQGRANPDVTSHRIVSYFWARLDTAENSGNVTAIYSNGSAVIAQNAALQRYRLETISTSATSNRLDFLIDGTTSTGSFNLYVDDILIAIDVLDLQIDRSIQDLREITVQRHSTIGGRESAFVWNEFGKWTIPIRYLPTSEANLIDLWWRDNRPLLFTLDTSDTAEIFIAHLVNPSSPIGSLQAPYQDLVSAVLEIEALSFNLVF